LRTKKHIVHINNWTEQYVAICGWADVPYK